MRSAMNFQSTSIGFSSITFTTHRDVSHAQGQTGSQKNSRSAMGAVLSGRRQLRNPRQHLFCEQPHAGLRVLAGKPGIPEAAREVMVADHLAPRVQPLEDLV